MSQRYVLRIFRGADSESSRSIGSGESVVVGRSTQADVRLFDRTTSRQHARLTGADEGVWVEDLQSGSGTYLNGQPLTERRLATPPAKVHIGRYRLEIAPAAEVDAFVWDTYAQGRILGQGGYGRVYEASGRSDGASVAVKEVDLGAHPQLRDRFEREARLCTGLDHPNVVRVHDVAIEGSLAYQVMERIEGGVDLVDRLVNGPLPIADVVQVGIGAARGLHGLHELGVIHRDIKPANIMLTSAGVVKLTDFGLARSTEPGMTLTKDMIGLGTLAYVAPEQALNARSATPASDLYGLGATLYHLLTGGPPFTAATVEIFLFQISQRGVVPPSAKRPECPEALDEVVLRCLAQEPEDRFESGAALADALVRVGQSLR